MLPRAVLAPLVLSALGACGPRVHATRTPRGAPTTSGTIVSAESSPQPTTAPTSVTTATATTAATTTSAATTTTAAPTSAPTTTSAPSSTSEPAPLADDLVPACRANCDALRNACAAGDPSGCYALCDEYDRTLARACRTPMATYFRCLSWTANCDGGQPHSDTEKCGALKQALEECKAK